MNYYIVNRYYFESSTGSGCGYQSLTNKILDYINLTEGQICQSIYYTVMYLCVGDVQKGSQKNRKNA